MAASIAPISIIAPRSTDNQQSQPGNQIEEQEKDLEQSDKRIEDHVESLPGHGEKLVLGEVDKLRGQMVIMIQKISRPPFIAVDHMKNVVKV